MNGHETGRKSIYHNGHAARSSLAPQSTARAVIFLIWPTSLLLNLCPAYIVARTEFLDETRDSRANCYINSPPTPAASYTPRRNWKLVVVVEFIKTRRMEQCVYLLDLKKKKKKSEKNISCIIVYSPLERSIFTWWRGLVKNHQVAGYHLRWTVFRGSL